MAMRELEIGPDPNQSIRIPYRFSTGNTIPGRYGVASFIPAAVTQLNTCQRGQFSCYYTTGPDGGDDGIIIFQDTVPQLPTGYIAIAIPTLVFIRLPRMFLALSQIR